MTLFGPRRWPVTLQHGPVGLRPLRLGDEREYHELRRRNAAWTGPWDATRPPESEGDPWTYAQMVRLQAAEARDGRTLPWAITWSDAGAPPAIAGQMTISGITLGAARWCDAGYWVDVALAGRGIVPTALALAGDYCFGVLRLHRFVVAIRPENAASLRVVEKLGFRYEGSRPRYLHVDGDWRDHLMFALHAEEVGPGGFLGRLPAR